MSLRKTWKKDGDQRYRERKRDGKFYRDSWCILFSLRLSIYHSRIIDLRRYSRARVEIKLLFSLSSLPFVSLRGTRNSRERMERLILAVTLFSLWETRSNLWAAINVERMAHLSAVLLKLHFAAGLPRDFLVVVRFPQAETRTPLLSIEEPKANRIRYFARVGSPLIIHEESWWTGPSRIFSHCRVSDCNEWWKRIYSRIIANLPAIILIIIAYLKVKLNLLFIFFKDVTENFQIVIMMLINNLRNINSYYTYLW